MNFTCNALRFSSVIDTRNRQEISLDDAVQLGIIKPDEGAFIFTVTVAAVMYNRPDRCSSFNNCSFAGTYHDLKTGDRYPIPVAMNAGLINVDVITTKKSKEKVFSVGIITVKTERTPPKPYKVLAVQVPSRCTMSVHVLYMYTTTRTCMTTYM